MHLKKRNIITLSILLLTAVATLGFVYNRSVWRAERAVSSLLRQIEHGNINDLNLTIYHAPAISTPFPWSIDNLISAYNDSRVIVDGARLEEYIYVINRLNDINLTPVRRRTYIDARLYYVFRDRNNRRVLDVAVWGSGGSGNRGRASAFVNGVEVEWDGIFVEIILPFLPDEAYRVWESSARRD